ncbi:MAG: RNA polymerase sigma factor RpoH [Rickettsiales bacterium]|jgi:RNA polymerase sigma-32 factor|nr:RNA polymerase sigma factor RpoH [Rickettsiales bacterium]
MSSYLPAISDSNTGFLDYLRTINNIPSLEQSEEYILSKRYSEDQDMSAAQKLVESHLKLVAKVAMSFRNYGLPVVELVSEGNIGLMQAVKKFDPERGIRLSTYAMWWIRASIQEYILKSWSLVKIGTTAAQKKLFFNLGRLKRKIFNTEGRDFNSDDYGQVASELNVAESEVAEMDVRLKQDKFLDDPVGEEDGGSLLDLIPETRASQEIVCLKLQEQKNRKNMLQSAMSQLNEREQYIITARKLSDSPMTLEDLSCHFSVSKERIRQIEEKAMEKMTSFVSSTKVA